MNNLHWKLVRTEKEWYDTSKRYITNHIIECSCGKQRKIRNYEWLKLLNNITNSRTNAQCKECKIKKYWENFSDKDNFKSLFKILKTSCKRINRECTINFKTAKSLYSSNCYYCNKLPSNTFINSTNKEKRTKYSGIDRIDSDKGYIKGNVVSCCKQCNIAKNNLNQLDFFKLVENIYRYRVQRLSSTEE